MGAISSSAAVSFVFFGAGLGRFRSELLRWYDGNRRDLPWRKSSDPYRIWLSEIMLQQTRVAAVLDYYENFLERFPDVRALAAASEDVVLAAWSGLGYYRRARFLHRCAREIVAEYGGHFPKTSEALLTLPGIGRYTAAAVASIAFAEPVAVVDGNVERVTQRLTGVNLTAPQIWQQAQTLLDELRPGDFNQAMMELGATVCLPRAPRCSMCPVRKWCATQGELPRAEARTRQTKREIWCALDWRINAGTGSGDTGGKGKVRLVQRPKNDTLMPGMWELPQWPEPPRALPASALWRTFKHSITVTDYTVYVLRNAQAKGSMPTANAKWVAIDRIAQIPITGLARKILKAGGII
jgi:A/G-specific adenine glycosylase